MTVSPISGSKGHILLGSLTCAELLIEAGLVSKTKGVSDLSGTGGKDCLASCSLSYPTGLSEEFCAEASVSRTQPKGEGGAEPCTSF